MATVTVVKVEKIEHTTAERVTAKLDGSNISYGIVENIVFIAILGTFRVGDTTEVALPYVEADD